MGGAYSPSFIQRINSTEMQNLKTAKRFVLSVCPTEYKIPAYTVKESRDINEHLKDIHRWEGNDVQEFFYVVMLNVSNRVTGYYVASMGGITSTTADPRLILKAAVLADCVKIVLCHNHPSGNLKPSKQDEDLTRNIKLAAGYLSIQVLDHLIINEAGEYYSFADEGIL